MKEGPSLSLPFLFRMEAATQPSTMNERGPMSFLPSFLPSLPSCRVSIYPHAHQTDIGWRDGGRKPHSSEITGWNGLIPACCVFLGLFIKAPSYALFFKLTQGRESVNELAPFRVYKKGRLPRAYSYVRRHFLDRSIYPSSSVGRDLSREWTKERRKEGRKEGRKDAFSPSCERQPSSLFRTSPFTKKLSINNSAE